jgi:hypothetical protein
MNFSGLSIFLKASYDKLLAAGVSLLLAGCLIYLGYNVGVMREQQQRESKEISEKTPEHPQARMVADGVYSNASRRLLAPFQAKPWTNASLFVPETRVWCVDARCRRPVPLQAQVCPFCGTAQPGELKDPDMDRDGMEDAWEIKNGLNPRDPSDAVFDADSDGYSNLQEFRYKTNPRDASDRPPITANLELISVRPNEFNLLFKSVLSLPGGGQKFAVNTRNNARTYFVKLGETIEGFVVERYEQKTEKVERNGMTFQEDRSILYLSRQGKVIPLKIGEVRPYMEYTAMLRWLNGGKELAAEAGSAFDVQGDQFRVISVDSKKEAVVIVREIDGKQFEICKVPQAERKKAE